MSDNNEEIEKIFNELMSSNAIQDIVHEDRSSIVRELIHIQESLLESAINVNALVHAMVVDETFEIDSTIFELLGPLYKISEDFIAESIGLNDTIDEDTSDGEEDQSGE